MSYCKSNIQDPACAQLGGGSFQDQMQEMQQKKQEMEQQQSQQNQQQNQIPPQ